MSDNVTVVFSDLAGSTKLGESLDPEALRTILGHYFDEMRAALMAEGGVIEKIIGDAIVATFADDNPAEGAVRALRAVAGTQSSLSVLNEFIEDRWGVQLVVRTGVATGPLIVDRLEGGHSVLGGAVMTLAESLESASPHFEALVDDATRDLAGDGASLEVFGDVPVKGEEGTLAANLLKSVDFGEGGSAIRECEHCGAELEVGRKECGSCGAAVSSTHETRRTVSVVFAAPHLVHPGGEEISDESSSGALGTFFDQVRPLLERHGATVETFIGDAVMAVFGLPVRREDDALRAVRSAFEVSRHLDVIDEQVFAEWGLRIECPIGVNTGEVVAGDASLGQRLVTGDTVNVAARLEQSAASGEVLIGALTERLARSGVVTTPVEPLTLKGKSEPVPAFRVDGLQEATKTPSRALPMVGRDAELAALLGAADRLHTDGGTLITLIGDAGVGKSRLLDEFLDQSGVAVARGRCLPYGDGITFWPVAEMLRSITGIRDDDSPEVATGRIAEVLDDQQAVDRLASLAGFNELNFNTSELFWAVRVLLQSHSGGEPLVALFEDIHWGEGTFLDLIKYLEDAFDREPILILCASRRSLLERDPEWGSGDPELRIELEPLTEADAEAIVRNLLGGVGLGDRITQRIVQVAEGNPLFVEQLMSMLIDDGQIVEHEGGWVPATNLDDLALPPSIHALLAARIDSLAQPERQVLEPASVVGKMFAQDAVRHLLGQPVVTPELESRLSDLALRQILDEAEEADDVGRMLRFHHALLRDAAYQGLLKETRARFHESFVTWADEVNAASGRGLEFEEILGFHLEQCWTYRQELGPLDAHTVELGKDGSRRLASAGRRAFARGDMPAAGGLLARAAALLDDEEREKAVLTLQSGEARFETGAFEEARSAIASAQVLFDDLGDVPGATVAKLEGLRFAFMAGEVEAGSVEAEAEDLVQILSEHRHHAGLARAYRLLASIAVFAEDFGSAERAALVMVDEAAQAGDDVLEMRTLQNLAVLAPVGPTRVPEAITRCNEVLERVRSDRRAAANTRRALAQLHAMQGEFDEARRLYRDARATLEELGWRLDTALVALDSGPIEMLAGEPDAAMSELAWGIDALGELGDTFFVPTLEAYLAEALYRLGDYEGAAAAARRCRDTVDEDDIAPQVLWRGVQARLDARAGAEGALAMAAEGAGLARSSDSPTLRADAVLAYAEVARLTGDLELAADLYDEAMEWYWAKGSIASIDIASRLVPLDEHMADPSVS